MLPLVINNHPERLVQITMTGSVGVAGSNARDDVVLVQSLLNATPEFQGGPQTKLKVDGIVGPLTTGAIRRYQTANTRVVDGRVDAHGPTIKTLALTLNDRGALPSGLPNIGQPSPAVVRALNMGGTAAQVSAHVAIGNRSASRRPPRLPPPPARTTSAPPGGTSSARAMGTFRY